MSRKIQQHILLVFFNVFVVILLKSLYWCTKHSASQFAYIISNPNKNTMKCELLSTVYIWVKWGTKELHDLDKLTELREMELRLELKGNAKLSLYYLMRTP